MSLLQLHNTGARVREQLKHRHGGANDARLMSVVTTAGLNRAGSIDTNGQRFVRDCPSCCRTRAHKTATAAI